MTRIQSISIEIGSQPDYKDVWCNENWMQEMGKESKKSIELYQFFPSHFVYSSALNVNKEKHLKHEWLKMKRKKFPFFIFRQKEPSISTKLTMWVLYFIESDENLRVC